MQPITSQVKALFDAEQRQLLRITGIDRNGKVINITEADVLSGSFRIDRSMCTGNKLEVGTAIASEMTLKLNNYDKRFDSYAFESAELFVEIGIADWSLADPVVTWLPCGYFTPDVQPRTLSIITIHALDRMMRFDRYVLTEAGLLASHTDNNIVDASGNYILVAEPMTTPCTLASLVQQTCERVQIPMTQDISGFVNADYTLASLPVLDAPYTYRNIIQWCAGLMASNAYINQNGELVFAAISYADRNVSVWDSTIDKRYASDVYENAITITGAKRTFKGIEGVDTVKAGNELGCVFDYTKNKLLPDTVAALSDWLIMMQAVVAQCRMYFYTPFTATVVAAPYLWPMDRIRFFTTEGYTFTRTLLTNVNFTINGCTRIQAVGETEQSATYSQYN